MEKAPAKANLWLDYRTEIVIVIVGVMVMNLIFFAGAFRDGGTIDRSAAGQLGEGRGQVFYYHIPDAILRPWHAL